MVFLSVSGGVWKADKVMDMRVLPQVHEAGKVLPISPGLHCAQSAFLSYFLGVFIFSRMLMYLKMYQ